MYEGDFHPGDEFALPIKGEQEPETDTRVADAIKKAFPPEAEVAVSHSIGLTLDANTGGLTALRDRFIQIHRNSETSPLRNFSFRSEEGPGIGVIEFIDSKVQEAFEEYLKNAKITFTEGVGHIAPWKTSFTLNEGQRESTLIAEFKKMYMSEHPMATDTFDSSDFNGTIAVEGNAVEVAFSQLEVQKAFDSFLYSMSISYTK